MDARELSRNDGREGRKAYIAYKGIVYDVTDNSMWEGGSHMEMLQAGQDVTDFLEQAPHGEEVLEQLDVVGKLEGALASPGAAGEPDAEPSPKARLKSWYKRFHPHPMTVHFPIALHFFAGGMDLLFLFDPTHAYELSVFYSFFAATVMGMVAMIPGLLSWWVNYDLSMARPFAVKLYVALFTLIVGCVAIALRLEWPTVAYDASVAGYLYHSIVLATVGTVIILGYYGGKITWSGR